jgi:hypothetical protein
VRAHRKNGPPNTFSCALEQKKKKKDAFSQRAIS